MFIQIASQSGPLFVDLLGELSVFHGSVTDRDIL